MELVVSRVFGIIYRRSGVIRIVFRVLALDIWQFDEFSVAFFLINETRMNEKVCIINLQLWMQFSGLKRRMKYLQKHENTRREEEYLKNWYNIIIHFVYLNY